MSRARTLGYWISTGLVALALLGGGLSGLFGAEEMTANMLSLGYPLYFLTILGLWKVLGAIAIVAPGFPRLKEWAYAGIAFDLSGAVWSHLSAGHPWSEAFPAAFLTVLTVVSWRLRPAGRVLGTLE